MTYRHNRTQWCIAKDLSDPDQYYFCYDNDTGITELDDVLQRLIGLR